MDVLLQEKMASERMKVELVTNVSHDLKTPLTSMISYIQLLKDEEMSEDAKLYVDVLDEKSEHLKKMVLDVFDLSKAATGQLDVDIKEIDYSKLMAQTLADMSKEIENSEV